MIILNKTIDDITGIIGTIPESNSCDFIANGLGVMIKYLEDNSVRAEYNYKDIVAYALDMCKKEIPSPFSSLYPNCYGLNLGNDFFTLRIPNKFGFGIRVVPTKKKLTYELSLVFYNNKLFVENSDYYKDLLEEGWKVKEK